jgi:hypothetical protein
MTALVDAMGDINNEVDNIRMCLLRIQETQLRMMNVMEEDLKQDIANIRKQLKEMDNEL